MAETFDYITVTTPDGSVQYKAPPMAAEFSASASYAAGDYCTYQGALYRFSAAHAAGAWTGTDATVVSLAGDVSDLRSQISGGGLTDDIKEALLNCFLNVAWSTDQGEGFYDALEDALYNTTWAITNTLSHCTTSNEAQSVTKGAAYSATITASAGYTLTGATVSITMGGTDITSSAYSNGTITIAAVTGALVITITAAEAAVSSISAVYTQSGTVYTTDSLDSLKDDLVVTATLEDTSTVTVPSDDYTLSGTLTAGTSTITVTFASKTTTFAVTVTQADTSIYNWDFSTSLIDTRSSAEATLSGATQDSNGINFTAVSQYVDLGAIYARNRTFEIDITTWSMQGSTSYNNRLLMVGTAANTSNGLLVFKHGDGWSAYVGSWSSGIFGTLTDRNAFANSTLKITIDSDGVISLYVNGTLAGSASVAAPPSAQHLYLGTSGTANLGSIYNSTITGFRVYEGVA